MTLPDTLRAVLPRLGALAAVLPLALASLASSAPPAEASSEKAEERLTWVDSYDQALARAGREDKIVLLDFYTDWCGWCRRLDRDVFAKESFQKAAGDVIGVKVNPEKSKEGRELAQEFRVTSYPRLFLIDAEGHTLERIRGYMSLPDFTKKVRQVLDGDSELERLQRAASDPTNLQAAHAFARFLNETGRMEDSIPYWQQVHDLAVQQLFENPGARVNEYFHRQSLLRLGEAFASVGLKDVARSQLQELTSTYPTSQEAPEALYVLAELDLSSGEGDQAVKRLNQIAQNYPSSRVNRRAQLLRHKLRAVAAKD